MTRETEIEQQTFVYYETCSDEDIAKSKGFIDGAKWADKTIIDKACNWLKDRISIPYEGNYNEDGEQPIASDYINFAIERLKKAEEFCKGFKKAVEE